MAFKSDIRRSWDDDNMMILDLSLPTNSNQHTFKGNLSREVERIHRMFTNMPFTTSLLMSLYFVSRQFGESENDVGTKITAKNRMIPIRTIGVFTLDEKLSPKRVPNVISSQAVQRDERRRQKQQQLETK